MIETSNNKHPLYSVWHAMKQRCHGATPNERYGGRGISVCSRWRRSFDAFVMDMGPKPAPESEYSIERIDNDGNYEPGHCRWATMAEQALNRSTNKRPAPRPAVMPKHSRLPPDIAERLRTFIQQRGEIEAKTMLGVSLSEMAVAACEMQIPIALEEKIIARINKRKTLFGLSSPRYGVSDGRRHTLRLALTLIDAFARDLDATVEDCAAGESVAHIARMNAARELRTRIIDCARDVYGDEVVAPAVDEGLPPKATEGEAHV